MPGARFAGALLAASLLSACVLPIPIPLPVGQSLEPSRWQVVAINDQPTPGTDSYRVEFRNGQFGGRLGCNHFGGPYRLRGATLIVGQVASTMMACSEPAMSHERMGLAALAQPLRMGWSEAGTRLTLSGAAGSIALEKMR
jgi:heat shock protein HslJ